MDSDLSPVWGGTSQFASRAGRVRARVHDTARELLRTGGPAALTHTHLAQAGAASTQTLYHHWPTRTALLASSLPTAETITPIAAGTDLAVVLFSFLAGLRADLRDTASFTPLLALAAQAPTDSHSAAAVDEALKTYQDALNHALIGTDWRVGPVDLANLTGPLFVHELLYRQPAPDLFLHRIIDAWLHPRQHLLD